MNLEDLLIEILESFGYPVMLQGSMLPDDKYPNHFFTFWNNSSSQFAFLSLSFKSFEESSIFSFSFLLSVFV